MTPADFNRRELFRTAAAAGFASALPSSAGARVARAPDRIRIENEKPGTRDWIASNVRVDPATRYRSPAVEGYASRQSVRPGESLSVHVSTNPPSLFVIDLYRLGYYQDNGARFVERLGPFRGEVQPDPPIGENRLRECQWEPCATLTIPDDWTSGVYLGKLTAERDESQSYIIFIVRDDRPCDFLFQCSDNTWNAYNRWPSQFALYDNGENPWYWGPNVEVSFDRPYGKYCQILDAPLSVGSGEFLLWEFPLAYWMEQQGYDVSYIANVDTHRDPDGLLRAKSFLSVGHDEYWSLAMYDHVKRAIEEGVNAAFLSGNAVCGVVPMMPSTDGRAHRIITRTGLFGGVDDIAEGFPDMTLLKQDAPNEGLLIGSRNMYPVTGGGDWICSMPDHWLFEGTGMKAGDGIPGLVGWEWHGDPAPIEGLEVVSTGPVSNGNVEAQYAATIYPGPKGNHVFNAATCWWADGLAEPPGYVRPSAYSTPKGPDSRVQRITANLFERFLNT